MTMQWFVLQALTGQEQKAQKWLQSQIRQKEMQEYIGEVIVPMEKVQEVRNNKKTTVLRKFFPGYVLIQAALYDSKRRIIQPTWQFIQETPGIIGFLGGDNPVPLTESEVSNIINRVEETAEKVRPKVSFDVGESVCIIDGSFMSFIGTIDEVDPDRGRIKVSVAIFGRTVPVELEYWQVERVIPSIGD